MKILVMFFVLLPGTAFAQLTYEQRAAFAKDQTWQDRVGVAAQQQAVLAQGENPANCCQTSAQDALAPGNSNLCSLVIPPGVPTAPAYVQNHSIKRHEARALLAREVVKDPLLWAQRMSGSIASDSCVAPPFTDTQLQAYMTRAWDLWALTPELAAPPVLEANPTRLAPGAAIGPDGVVSSPPAKPKP
jgi:hypothetical protein